MKKELKIPRHIAIIMDGNGRWAKQRNLPRIKGHQEGSKAVEEVIRASSKMGVEFLTLYAFSVENWSRPKSEVSALMQLLLKVLRDYEKTLIKEDVRLQVIGRISDLPDNVQKQLQRTIELTSNKKKMTLILALSYGGRVELTSACRALAEKVKAGQIDLNEIDEASVEKELYTKEYPDPDLLIRTSGEMRVSNFLLWQISYSEIVVSDVLWPDFRECHLREAIVEYSSRQRRFGGVG